MTQQDHMTTGNPNPDQNIYQMLKDLLNQGIKPAIHAHTQAIENMVTRNMVTLLNTQTASQERIHDALRQDNVRLHNQIQYLSEELRSTIAVRTPPTWTPTQSTTSALEASDPSVTAAAANC